MEEDIFIMAYGLPLKVDGDEKCLSILHLVEETVARQLKACKASPSKKRVVEAVEPLQTKLEFEEGFCKAVLCRLRFRKLDSILKSEEFLRHTCACGALEDEIEDKTTASGCKPIGFDSTLNNKSAAPTPPRTIKLLSWKKAVNYFQKLLHDLEILYLVSRTYIQLLLVQDGKLYGREPMFNVVCKAALLPEGTRNHDIQKNESVAKLGQLLINLLRLLCTNTAWQRRKLGKILQDWRIIYVQLELAFRKEFGDITSTPIDQVLQNQNELLKKCIKLAIASSPSPVAQNEYLRICKHILIWVEEQTYWIALRFLILGFELELYSASEYCMVYWYLYVILIKLAEKTHLKVMLSHDSSRLKSKKKRDSVKDVRKDYQIPSAVLLLQCYIYVAEGLMMMLASLRNENKILTCMGPFNSEQERFMQHFELLQKACLPDHASYFTFTETIANARFSTLSIYNCFKDAQRIAKELRGNFASDPDRFAELRRIEQVAEHNSVALNLICRLGTLEPSLKVSFEFIHHPHFALAAVKRS
ncbi:hypothetical protein OROMI_002614 [Orobanche minor]